MTAKKISRLLVILGGAAFIIQFCLWAYLIFSPYAFTVLSDTSAYDLLSDIVLKLCACTCIAGVIAVCLGWKEKDIWFAISITLAFVAPATGLLAGLTMALHDMGL